MVLTGGIGSGKSTVAGFLVECGALLIDTDAIARELTASGGAAMPGLIQRFGATIATADGALDRGAMRQLAFMDLAARQALEAVLHPMIGSVAVARAQAAGSAPAVVFDVPLLGQASHWRSRVQRVLVVDCDEATQVERVVQRSGWDAETVRRVIAQQTARTARRTLADAVIFNQGLSLPALREEVRALWRAWVGPPVGPG